ncbi:MAG: InlB B-repeat-containing protein [Rikenellaceae bacterium]
MKFFLQLSTRLTFLFFMAATIYSCSTTEDPEIQSYVITFECNEGTSVDPISVVSGSLLELDCETTREGYTFGGWYSCDSLEFEWDFSTPITENITLYAKWYENLTIIYETGEGSPITSNTISYNAVIPEPDAPTRTGYDFDGWYTSDSYSTAWDFDNLVTTPTTLYAKWTIATYVVTFNSNGGSEVSSQSIVYNTYLDEPESPSRNGYTFDGWYSNSSLTTVWIFSTAITSNTTLYAKWIADKCTITFDCNGGLEMESQEWDYDSNITEPSKPTKTGYTFVGWYSNQSLTTSWDFSVDVVKGDMTLYAKWDINSYTVTFNSNGGSDVSSQSIVYNTSAEEPASPTKVNYSFDGWYSDSSLTILYDFDDKVVDNITLYALWLEITESIPDMNVEEGW